MSPLDAFTPGMLQPEAWRRSTFCASNGCVEVAVVQGMVHVRDSKKTDSPILTFDADEWRAFLAGARSAEFDI